MEKFLVMNSNLLTIAPEILVNRIVLAIILVLVVYLFLHITGTIKYFSFKKDLVSEYMDITGRLKAIEYAPNGIITCTNTGTIVTWNTGAEKIFGWKDVEIIGKNLTVIIPEEYRPLHLKAIELAKESGFVKMEGQALELEGLRKDKTIVPIELRLSQWNESNSIYYTGIVRDITDDKIQKEFHDILLKIYIEAEEITNYGAWKWSLATDNITVTQGFRKIWELEDAKYDYYALMSRVHFEDRPGLDKIIQDAITNKSDYSASYRIVGRNGTIKHVTTIVKLVINTQGTVEKLIGVIHEIKK